MKILFLNAYFFPEVISFTHLEHDLIEGLIDAGHEIYVICPVPTRGISKDIVKKYRSIKKEDLYNGQVHVHRFWAPQEGKNPIIRAFRYLWCNLREYNMGKKYKGIDLIFAVSTPPTQGLLAGKLSKKLNCPFIFSLQDVFPDSLITTGITHKGSLIWKIGRKIENKTYQTCDKIIVISNEMMKNLRAKGVDKSKLVLISNWVDTKVIKPISRRNNKLIYEYGIDSDKFLVVYAGNLGAAQGAEMILNAAEKLIAEQQIQFIIFGGGIGFASAKAIVKDRKIDNVMIYPLLPQDRVSEVYSLGDVALITCKPGVGGSGMPSKTWSIMACNTPIIASFDIDSDMAAVLKQSHSGICIRPNTLNEFVEAILKARENPRDLHNGRAYVLEHASRTICVGKYIDIITLDYCKER